MNEQESWYEETAGFFGPEYLDLYGETMSPETTHQEAGFIVDILGLEPGAEVLDMPCGHGRHLVELASRGCVMTGVDINSFFLTEAACAADERGVVVDLRQGDMRTIELSEGEFDAGLNLCTALGYFDSPDDDVVVLRNFARSLKRGGKLLIEFQNRENILTPLPMQRWREVANGTILLEKWLYNVITGKVTVERLIIPKEGTLQRVTSMHYHLYSPADLVRMGLAAGLRFVEGYGDYRGSQLTTRSPKVLLIFEKP